MPQKITVRRAVAFSAVALFGLLQWETPLHAQNLDVPVPSIPDGQAAGCGGSRVTGLDPNGDNFLAVRSGPGTNYSKIDELHTGDRVRTCELRGEWVGVYYGQGGNRKSGWVHRTYLADEAG